MTEKLLEAMRLALEIKKNKKPGGPDAFAEWSPNINTLFVRIYRTGFKAGQDADRSFDIDADGIRCYQEGGNIDKCLTELRRTLEDAGGTP